MVDAIEKEFYSYCLAHNEPYLERIMHARRGNPIRHAYMQLLVQQECRRRQGRPFHILEIGSWAGGSAITWAEAIKQFSSGGGIVVCIDKREPHFEPWQCREPGPYREMNDALSSRKIFELFIHNIRASGHDDIVIPFKGWSDELLPLLGENRFDVVFVDGNHAYASVLKDIRNAEPLLSEGGVICGDDLELQVHELDLAYAEENRDKDYIRDPKTQKQYHPGVSLAVRDFFGEASAWEGFWAMRKQKGCWQKVVLAGRLADQAAIPRHLRAGKARNYLRFGEELYKAGRVADAKEAFQRACALDGDSAEVHKALAVVCRKLNSIQEAVWHARLALEFEPHNAGAMAESARKAGQNEYP